MLGQSVRSALMALRAYKLRSVLTILGVVVGVAALLLVLHLSQVTQEYIDYQWAHTGANLVTVGFQPPPGMSKGEAISHSTLTPQDVQALQRLPHVVAASPLGYDGLPVIAGPITSKGWPIEAGAASLQSLQDLTMQSGSFFTDQDEASGSAVAAIGPEVATHFFPGVDPVGKDLRIGAVTFRVVGVVSQAGGLPGDNYVDQTYIPYSTYQQRLSGHDPIEILLQADQAANVQAVMHSVSQTLAQQHRIGAGQPADFAVYFNNASADPQVHALHTVRLVLGIVALIALIVGGFGIAVTMLFAVQQRTREIGIRLAVGAQPSDVGRQFLAEAATLSLLGGVVGILVGLVGAYGFYRAFREALLGHWFRQAVQDHPLPSPLAILAALAVCVLIGVAFGYLPARRASRLDPIRPLRAT